MSAGHAQSTKPEYEGKLKIALALTGTYLIAEVVGGLVTGSLALLSDAAHMLTDVMALAIALVAIRVGRRAADRRRTFGYARFEILAAAFNALVLFGVAIYILVEAYRRFQTPPKIESMGMLVVAAIGLVVNVVSMRLLRESSETSLNAKGAYLEVLSDLVGSVGVIVAALVIRFTGWWQVDPILGALIGLWVLPRTWTLLMESMNVLLEGVPAGMDLDKLHADLAALPGVKEVHDLHVWEITSGQGSMTVHLVAAEGAGAGLVAQAQAVAEAHKIEHSSVQIEDLSLSKAEEGAHPNLTPGDPAPPH